MKKDILLISLIATCIVLSAFKYDRNKRIEAKCLQVSEGYIVHIKGNDSNKALSISSDYFFFKEKPSCSKKTNPKSLFFDGGKILNISHLRAANFERVMTKDYIEFDQIGKSLELYKAKDFDIQVYRVIMASYEKKTKLVDFISIESTSHTYSYLINLPPEEKEKQVELIFPELISNW